jgi:hypothetical protein
MYEIFIFIFNFIFKLNGEKYIEVSRRIIGIRWIKVISNIELWETTGEKTVMLQITFRRWRLIGHTLRNGKESIEKQALDWNPQEARRRARPKQTWKRTLMEDAESAAKRGVWLKVWRATKSDGDALSCSMLLI